MPRLPALPHRPLSGSGRPAVRPSGPAGLRALALLAALTALPVAVAAPASLSEADRARAALPATAIAQTQGLRQRRQIPLTARLGSLKLGVFPQATLDGKSVVLGAGFRLFDADNRIVVPASVIDTTFVVAYTSGPIGELLSAWTLSQSEIREWLASTGS